VAENEAQPQSASRPNLVAEHYFGVAEKTFEESSYVWQSLAKPFNTDDIYSKTGDYTIYETMKVDDQISVAMQLKKDLVIGSGWDVLADKDGDPDIATDINNRLENDPEVALDDQLEELIETSYSFGFACSEKLFKMRDDNSLTWNELKTRHPASWLLHTDQHGNMEKYEQRGRDENISVDPKSLIHYINNRQFQNPYGRSDLRSCYDAWFVKRHIIRFYSIFLEKHASPTPISRYDKKAPKDKVTEIFNIIKNFQTKTAMVIPKEFEIEFLESKSNGEAYIRGINLFNMFIGRSLVIPDLLGFSGSGSESGGSQALGREQMSVFLKHIMRRRRTLERTVNRHIIQPLVLWNHGFVENFPKFKLKPISEEDAVKYAETFIKAVNGKLYIPSDEEINHFRSLIKFPEGQVERMDLAPPGDDLDLDSEFDDDIEGENIEKKELSKKKVFKAFNQTEGTYHKKVNFKSLKALLDAGTAKLVAESQPIIADIYEDLFNQIQKKKILEGPGGKPERIDDIKLKKLSQFQAVIKKNLKEHHRDSKMIARAELPKAQFTEPLPSEEFLKFLEQETFQYVGDWEYAIGKDVRRELMNAIKDGTPLSEVFENLDNSSKKRSRVSIERYARTKHTEVMNRARVEEFSNSGVVNGYQFSAIMDGRTTAICSGLHGKKFVEGKQPIPPLHFNCRSILIPITIFEEFKPDKKVGTKTIDSFIDKNIGSGFSRR